MIVDRDPGDETADETVENGGTLCVFCREDAALPGDDLCEGCQAEVIGEMLLERVRQEKEAA